jgi:general secretion pathway protein H
MVGIVGINFYKTWQREQLKMNYRQVAGILRQARSEAVARNRKVIVQFDLLERRFWVENISQKPESLPPVLAEKTQLVWQDQSRRQGRITFYGDGSSSGGRLTFSGPNQIFFTLEIDRITGQINAGSR